VVVVVVGVSGSCFFRAPDVGFLCVWVFFVCVCEGVWLKGPFFFVLYFERFLDEPSKNQPTHECEMGTKLSFQATSKVTSHLPSMFCQPNKKRETKEWCRQKKRGGMGG